MSKLAYSGCRFTIEYATLQDGSCPALEFFNGLDRRWQARMYYLYQRLGDTGWMGNEEQFSKVSADFYEFKAFQVRLLCYFKPGSRVVVTHGFIKKRNRMDRNELARAERIKKAYEGSLAQT